MNYIKESAIKKKVNANGKRISKEVLEMLDEMVAAKLQKLIDTHNGGKKTIDATVGTFCGLPKLPAWTRFVDSPRNRTIRGVSE